jgi:hypothetical protein
MKWTKLILFCILLIMGCEKEPININTEKFKKYQSEIKTTPKKNRRKSKLGKNSFNFSKILKTKNKKT